MFCVNCGSRIDDNAVACPHCGVATDNFYMNRNIMNRSVAPSHNDAPSAGFAVLCFFFPVVGLILYLVWHNTKPMRAKSCGKGAIICVIVVLMIFVVFLVMFIILYIALEFIGVILYCMYSYSIGW